ncbi:MAG: DUF4402 domain-containing protein [Chlorobiaceae bacterium]
MKNKIIALSCTVAMLVFGSEANAATSNTASANASATILTPIALTNTTPLAFGTIVPSTSAGTVTVATNGTRSGANVVLISTASTNGTASSAAAFDITGENSKIYSVTLPADNTVNITSGNDRMVVNSFTSDVATGGNKLTGGKDNFHVGGTLLVGASQAAGTYSGTFSVTAQYN